MGLKIPDNVNFSLQKQGASFLSKQMLSHDTFFMKACHGRAFSMQGLLYFWRIQSSVSTYRLLTYPT